MTDNTDIDDKSHPSDTKKWLWKPGQSGNPNGLPKWAQLKKQKNMMKEAAPEILAKVIELAKQGDPHAMKLCVDRISPRMQPKDVPLTVELPQIKKEGDDTAELMELGASLMNYVREGEVTSTQAIAMFDMMTSQMKFIETSVVQKAMDDLKEKLGSS